MALQTSLTKPEQSGFLPQESKFKAQHEASHFPRKNSSFDDIFNELENEKVRQEFQQKNVTYELHSKSNKNLEKKDDFDHGFSVRMKALEFDFAF